MRSPKGGTKVKRLICVVLVCVVFVTAAGGDSTLLLSDPAAVSEQQQSSVAFWLSFCLTVVPGVATFLVVLSDNYGNFDVPGGNFTVPAPIAYGVIASGIGATLSIAASGLFTGFNTLGPTILGISAGIAAIAATAILVPVVAVVAAFAFLVGFAVYVWPLPEILRH